MQSIPNPSWVYNITVCSTYGTGFALKLLRVRSLLVVDYQIIIILSSYHSKSPVNAMLGVLITPTSSTVLYYTDYKIPVGLLTLLLCYTTRVWLQNSCWSHSSLYTQFHMCLFIPQNLASLLMSLGDIVCVSVDLSSLTLG